MDQTDFVTDFSDTTRLWLNSRDKLLIKKAQSFLNLNWHTFGMSPIRIVSAGQLSGWYWYFGGEEKGLQT